MKLHAEISGQKYEIEITRGDKVSAVIDGRKYELEVSEPEPGVFLLKNYGMIFEAATDKAGDATRVVIRGREYAIKLTDPKRLRGSSAAGEQTGGLAEVKTAMPGKVVRILLRAGSEVERGQGVIVVEAMKMQNELKSPKAGIVKEVRTTEGSTVAAGDVLATIE